MQAMKKAQVHARLIERGSNFARFAQEHHYNARTVTQIVDRWVGKTDLPRGRLSFRVLKDLSRFIGEEVTPGIFTTTD